MGLTLQFATGDRAAIQEAIESEEVDRLDDPAVISRLADLSLHIEPRDLNSLSRSIGLHSGQEPIDLRPYLEVLVDEKDRGLLEVSPIWVRYVSAVSDATVPLIVDSWFGRMRTEYQDPEITVNDDAVEAVKELISLCKEARAKNEDVLHVWFV